MPGGQNTPDEPSGHRSEVRVVRLSELSVGYTPRQTRVDGDHVMALVEVIDRLPPIIVDERMIVIDGVHRIEAFRRAGRREIRAVLFTGDETEALTLAIRANVEHGKPLTRNERRAAARLLLRQHPDRSDRWVAEICGLSHATVASLRPPTEGADLELRTGRDGRRRSVNHTAGQEAVIETLAKEPAISLRRAAEVAGVAPSTAHRLAARQRAKKTAYQQPVTKPSVSDDPPLGPPNTGERSGADWLEKTMLNPKDIPAWLESVPLGRVYEVADECRRRGQIWVALADALDKQARASRVSAPRP